MNKAIRLHLVSNDLTVVQLARQLGLSRQYLYDIFQGNRPAPGVRKRLVEEFGFAPELVEYAPARSQAA